MELLAVNPKTGKEMRYAVQEPDASLYAFMGDFELTDEQVRDRIDRMSISADIKALLYSFSNATIKAGRAIVKIGRKIIDILFAVLREFPYLTFGAVFGLIVGALVMAIPIIGAVLAPLATPIAVGLGVVLGAKKEIETDTLSQRVQRIVDQFAPLRT